MNGLLQKLTVKSYSLSQQPFSESATEYVMKTLKPRGNVLKAKKIQKHKRKKQSILYWQAESPAEPASFQVKFGGSW